MHVIVNAYWEDLDFDLPVLKDGTANWRRWIDTALIRRMKFANGTRRDRFRVERAALVHGLSWC